MTAEFAAPRGVLAGREYEALPTLDAEAPDETQLREAVEKAIAWPGPAPARVLPCPGLRSVSKLSSLHGEYALCRFACPRGGTWQRAPPLASPLWLNNSPDVPNRSLARYNASCWRASSVSADDWSIGMTRSDKATRGVKCTGHWTIRAIPREARPQPGPEWLVACRPPADEMSGSVRKCQVRRLVGYLIRGARGVGWVTGPGR
jgi:hypothetical protein